MRGKGGGEVKILKIEKRHNFRDNLAYPVASTSHLTRWPSTPSLMTPF